MNLRSLSPKILKIVFSYLSLTDIKNLDLVCIYIRKIVSDPIFWSKSKLTKPKKSQNVLLGLEYKKFSQLSCLDLSVFELNLHENNNSKLLLNYLQNNSNLKSLNLSTNDLSMLPVVTFMNSICTCEEIILSKTNLKMEQATSILEAVSESKYICSLDMSFNDLKFVNELVLEKSLKRLTKFNFSNCNLSKIRLGQIGCIVETLTNSSIGYVDLSGSNMTQVTFDCIGFNQNLKTIRLCNVSFSNKFINYIFTNLSLVKSLSLLDLSNSTLSAAEPVLLSDAVIRIHHVNLASCDLTCEHAAYVLNYLNRETKIKELFLFGNDLAQLDQGSILNALKYLEVFQF